MAAAIFVGPNGISPSVAIRQTVQALTTVSVGDLLHVGMGYVSRIRERTFQGVDVNGAPFAPYSTRSPFYFYPNRDAASGRTSEGRAARATASKNRHAKTGRIGVRTPTGIRYESYAAAKAAHGVSNVNLFGMEQHPHMLDAMLVKAGGAESSLIDAEFAKGGSSEMNAFEANQPCTSMQLGFWGDEADRAKGHNEGTSKLPKREFFALNASDLAWGEKTIGERMAIRAKRGGGSAPAISHAAVDTGDEWDVGF
jgi:hypothetical protein